ncbi:MAG: transglutaminase domain-containing protein, partial [Planctomycetota bacterium]
MPTWSRSKTELLMMASIAMLAVWSLRARIEHSVCLGLEVATVLVLLGFALNREWSSAKKYAIGTCLFLVPVLFSFLARRFFTPVAFELTAFAVSGSVCLALVCLGSPRRLQAMSMVMGGFLVLFCATISDSQWFTIFPICWVVVCVWHLIAQRWERLDLAMPEQITRRKGVRPATTLMVAGVLVITGIIAKDRLWGTQKATWGFMPTSGGSQWSDPGARGGVGTGEKAIAAKDHAESFGAVDSDVFLESTKSTLYDMFSDSLGKPKKKTIREKRQGLMNENMLESHQKNSESQKAGSSFSMERGAPAKHQYLEDNELECVLQWDGPAGIRLGVERFDDFDGREWTPATLDNSPSDYRPNLIKKSIGEDVWFMHPDGMQRLNADPDRVSLGLIRIVDLQTHRIPTPMVTAGVHVKDIDRSDFFGLESDGSFAMPGRKRIPPLTVIHVASLAPTEDEIRSSLFANAPNEDRLAELDIPHQLEEA